MKSKLFPVILILLFVVSTIVVYSFTVSEDTKKEEKNVVYCPVSGEKVEKSTAAGPFEYKGKKYYFCCEDCLNKFKENPEKYAHHHSCVCLNTEKVTDYKAEYEGKTYYFCSEKCKVTFEKDPAGYMAKMKTMKDAGKIDYDDDEEGCSPKCAKECPAAKKCNKNKE